MRKSLPALVSISYTGPLLALVTNIGQQAAGAALERFGLAQHLGAVVTRDDVERMKPEPEGIRRALRHLACEGPALMVGDSLSDLFAARDAGIPVAILADGKSDPLLSDGSPYRTLNGARLTT